MAVKCKDNPNVDKFIDYIYTPDEQITKLCNDFIDITGIDVSKSSGFTKMLQYIASNTDKIDNVDIERMDYMFNIYTYIVAKCKLLPDLSTFCIMISLSYDTLMDWLSGQNRSKTHTQFVKKWNDICKGTCFTEAGNGSIGAIFVSKAIHKLSDQAPQAPTTQTNLYINAPNSREEIEQMLGKVIDVDYKELTPP